MRYFLGFSLIALAVLILNVVGKRGPDAKPEGSGTFDSSMFRRLIEWERQRGFSRSRAIGKFTSAGTTRHPKFEREIRFFAFSPNVRVTVDPQGNRILRLTRLGRNEGDAQDHPATWSQTAAINLAREAVCIITGEFPDGLAPSDTKFNASRGPKDRAYWRVYWPRSSRDGYRWILEGIGVELHEERGLEAFYDNRWSEFTEPGIGVPMRESAELERTARESAEAIQREDHSDPNLLKLIRTEVRVVSPNSYARPHAIWNNIKKATKEAVIARVFIFQRKRGHLIIYVDPFSGEPLGWDSA